MGRPAAVRAIHLVDCSNATDAAIRDALSDGLYDVRSLTVNDLRRRYISSAKRGDCILMESRQASPNLASLIDARRCAAEVPILVLTDKWSQTTLTTTLRCGATDLVRLPLERSDLVRCLDDINSSRLPRSIRIDRPAMAAGLSNLTRSEGRVLQCVLSAMTTQQISRTLHVGAQTVAKHKQHVLRKLGARNELELILQLVGNDYEPGIRPRSTPVES